MPRLLSSVGGADDAAHMRTALHLAEQARDCGEVPVGAVVTVRGEIIGRGYNQTITQRDPSAHAEILALREAANALGNHRLGGAHLYVTLEPCIMCAGAILHARIARLVIGASDERFGAAGGALNLVQSPFANHKCEVVYGVEAAASSALLREFFAARRE